MKKLNQLLLIGVLLFLISITAWGYQLSQGLVVTNLRNPFSWGLYIATFAFFVGIAAGGLIVSSSIYLFGIEQLKPFTRIASLSAFASIVGAGAIILPDIGRPERIYNMLVHPNFRSPLVWDVIVISCYLILTFLSVYFQLLPEWKKENRGFLNGWTKNLSQEQVEAISRLWSKRVSLIGLPFAILIHTVTALIFATQASRDWWHTAVLPPDFIAVATASGTALVMLISLLVVGKERFVQYKGAFKSFAFIIAGSLIVHFFFMYIDFLVRWWWGVPEELNPLALVFKKYGLIHLLEVALPAFVMIYFLTKKGRESYNGLITGSILLFIGVFAHRFLLMPASYNVFPLNFTLPDTEAEMVNYPIAIGVYKKGAAVFASFWHYAPSPVEIAVALLPFALVIIILTFMIKTYKFLPNAK
ncbi:NrfD/PsrC family molybdoenzyme membrane anchor subunit [Carboxydothermus pertinax]|uniref:Molybdopterin oxidoreductase n=1 Tax=Carboxydothermus pertinax TaxID=870242 RepID=A0A1L8CS53_9THEO|nr:NrfD/PsrC family molybdoenzyme membrane anchor subunit [Carboxydothermus pertinax]GAV21765.1 molybdopterin oxidoreductase [Carboxydothermus pertinax]